MQSAQVTGHGEVCTSVPAGKHTNVYSYIVCNSKGLETNKKMDSNYRYQPGWISDTVFNEKTSDFLLCDTIFIKLKNVQN